MAKKKKHKQESRTDQVRSAVDQAFQQAAGGAQLTRERAQELADELSQAAGKVRDALDELRPATGDDLKPILDRLEAIEARLTKLEKPAPRRRASTATRATTARSTAAAQAAARKQPARTARKPAAKSTAAKPAAKSTAKPSARKPAAG
jgi:uncharacterized protein YicC (UPF0701 family)